MQTMIELALEQSQQGVSNDVLELKQIEADDQAIQTILLVLPEDIYAAVDSCETAQEIWLRVQQMMKGSDIGIQEKKAKQYAGQNVGNLNGYNAVQNAVQNQRVQNVKNRNGLIVVPGTADQNPNGNADLDEIKEVNANCILMANLQQASTSGTQTDKAPVYDSDGSTEVPQNDNNVISGVFSVEQSGGTVQQHLANVKETCVLYDSLYNNLAIEVEKVNTKKLKSDFKIRKDELLDKQIQLENKIKELDNILVKTGQSIQTMHMLLPKPDSFYHTEQKMALGYQNPFYLKQAKQKQQSLYNGKVLLEKHDPPFVHDSEKTLQLAQERVFVSQMAKSREELYFSNTSKMANVFEPISIPNEEFLDDYTPTVAQKILNEVKSTIVTLQHVVKHRITLDTHNWSSSSHQELHKILKDEIFPIVNQVDARVQNFEIQFLKEAAKFVRDFKSLAKEYNESLAKHKALELEIERLLREVVSQDIMSVVQNNSVGDTSNLHTELERTKERFENYIIKKENEYAKIWNDWYKKCEEYKFDKISYDKAYNYMQQKIERLQAQLGDLKGKSKDTLCVSDTLNPLSQKLENENVELEF
nr:hypothetical protein [Tanacetum cinerariifolium]